MVLQITRKLDTTKEKISELEATAVQTIQKHREKAKNKTEHQQSVNEQYNPYETKNSRKEWGGGEKEEKNSRNNDENLPNMMKSTNSQIQDQ